MPAADDAGEVTMGRKRRTSGEAVVDPNELDDTGANEVRDEVGLFSCDYARWQRSRSDIPPPMVSPEPRREALRRR